MVGVKRKRQKDDNFGAPIELCRLRSKSHGIMMLWRLKGEQKNDHVFMYDNIIECMDVYGLINMKLLSYIITLLISNWIVSD